MNNLASDTTVYVVDDDSSVRKGLVRLIQAHGLRVEDYASAEEFLQKAKLSHPCCILLDVQMPGITGIQLQALLKNNAIDVSVIFLTAKGDVPIAVEAMQSGAIDFLTKPVDEQALFGAIARGVALDHRRQNVEQERRAIQQGVDLLTNREMEVLTYVIAGMLNKEIAMAIGIAEKTVKVHRGNMMKKMHADSVAGLVRLADKVGIQPAHSNHPASK